MKKLIYGAICLALAMIMPFITGQIPQLGRALCPMHLPVLVGGFICGGPIGAIIGFIAPLLRFAIFGMPDLITAIAMSFELCAYGFFSGLLYKILPKKTYNIYISLILAMLIGRVVWGLTMTLIATFGFAVFSFEIFITSAFLSTVLGIVIQIILIPIIIMALKKAKIYD